MGKASSIHKDCINKPWMNMVSVAVATITALRLYVLGLHDTEGNDLMQDEEDYDRYYFTYDEGKDTIDDKDGKGEIQFNGFPISGIPLEDKDNKGKRWVLGEEENGDVFILTRNESGTPDMLHVN